MTQRQYEVVAEVTGLEEGQAREFQPFEAVLLKPNVTTRFSIAALDQESKDLMPLSIYWRQTRSELLPNTEIARAALGPTWGEVRR
jgi:hypothetical protein